MRYEKIPLAAIPYCSVQDPDTYLAVYAPDAVDKTPRTAILVLPGGGYAACCTDREGEPVALEFAARGYVAFMLRYSVGEGRAIFPRPMIQASAAMKFIRDNAQKYSVDPARVYVTGFSAGGHLCAFLGTCWYREDFQKPAGVSGEENKPTGIIPVYPALSMKETKTWNVYYNCVFETLPPTEQQLHDWSAENWVDSEHTVPTCLIHTSTDELVSCNNSLVFAEKLYENNVPVDLHIISVGAHGFATANRLTDCGFHDLWDHPEVAHWPEIADDWMKRRNNQIEK